jgi:hypothetical protein
MAPCLIINAQSSNPACFKFKHNFVISLLTEYIHFPQIYCDVLGGVTIGGLWIGYRIY